jgi:cytochrome c
MLIQKPKNTGDASRGAELYVKQCEHCHTLEKDGAHVFGPNLWSIFGQKSGQIPGSKPTQVYKDMNITWTPGTMVSKKNF